MCEEPSSRCRKEASRAVRRSDMGGILPHLAFYAKWREIAVISQARNDASSGGASPVARESWWVPGVTRPQAKGRDHRRKPGALRIGRRGFAISMRENG